MRILFLSAAFVLLASSVGVHQLAAKADPASVEDLFRSPLIQRPSLSPRGDYLAAITAEENGTDGLLVYNLKTNEAKGLKGDVEYDVYSYRWLDEEHLVYNVSRQKTFAHGLYVAQRDALEQPVALNEFDVTRLIGVPRHRLLPHHTHSLPNA